MTRDEILQQYGGQSAEMPAPAPVTRDQILEQYGQAPPDPSTSFGMEMGRQVLSAGGLLPDGASNIAGAVGYVTHGGAPGSFEAAKQANIHRHEVSQETNPRAALLGDVASVAIPIPGVATAVAPNLAARAVEGALRFGGKAGQGFTLYSVLKDLSSGKVPSAADVLGFMVGRGSDKLANVMKARRVATTVAKEAEPAAKAFKQGFQGTGNPFSGPAPNASMRGLSPEMQAKSDAYQAFLRRYNIQ